MGTVSSSDLMKASGDVMIAELTLRDTTRVIGYDLKNAVFKRVADYIRRFGGIPRVYLTEEGSNLQSQMYSVHTGIPSEGISGNVLADGLLEKAGDGVALTELETSRLLEFLPIFKKYIRELQESHRKGMI